MRFLDPLVRSSSTPKPESRFSFQDYVMAFGGSQYRLSGAGASRPDTPSEEFVDYISRVHRRNGVVAAAVETRALLMSQLRFKWRRSFGDREGELWANRDLVAFERPGVDTRPAFLHRLELDASYAGSAYVAMVNGQMRRLRPDHCSVLLGSDSEPTWDGTDTLHLPYDADIFGLVYHPNSGGVNRNDDVTLFEPGEFTIYSPEPDPINFWRGTSWVTSVMREIMADGQATDHQSKFFESAATPNLVFLMDPTKSPEETRQFADITNKLHSGAGNAYKNMFLGGGTDVKVVGSSLESLNLKDLAGGFETRVALRARVPGVILGIREGYAGSSLNAGNYNSARRILSDGWFTPTAEALCASLERLIDPPDGSHLHYDRSAILFLQEDVQDAANIISTQAAAMRTLTDGGFDTGSVVESVARGDLSQLVHSGKLSVQLQPPGEGGDPSSDSMNEGSDDSD